MHVYGNVWLVRIPFRPEELRVCMCLIHPHSMLTNSGQTEYYSWSGKNGKLLALHQYFTPQLPYIQ